MGAIGIQIMIGVIVSVCTIIGMWIGNTFDWIGWSGTTENIAGWGVIGFMSGCILTILLVLIPIITTTIFVCFASAFVALKLLQNGKGA